MTSQHASESMHPKETRLKSEIPMVLMKNKSVSQCSGSSSKLISRKLKLHWDDIRSQEMLNVQDERVKLQDDARLSVGKWPIHCCCLTAVEGLDSSAAPKLHNTRTKRFDWDLLSRLLWGRRRTGQSSPRGGLVVSDGRPGSTTVGGTAAEAARMFTWSFFSIIFLQWLCLVNCVK